MSQEYLSLKWGSVKSVRVESEPAREALNRWRAGGVSMSAMDQHDTPEMKQALCDLIDVLDGEITNDWTGKTMTKDEAKLYVLNYGKEK
jgi:hypothetical protein